MSAYPLAAALQLREAALDAARQSHTAAGQALAAREDAVRACTAALEAAQRRQADARTEDRRTRGATHRVGEVATGRAFRVRLAQEAREAEAQWAEAVAARDEAARRLDEATTALATARAELRALEMHRDAWVADARQRAEARAEEAADEAHAARREGSKLAPPRRPT